MFYNHERTTREQTGLPNTVWPPASTDLVDTVDAKLYLADRGLSTGLAYRNGWYPSRNAVDTFLRIVIPAESTQPGHAYWQARAVSPNAHIRYQTPKGPRYGALIYVKAFPNAVDPSDKVLVAEGPMDALAAAQFGYDAIALMGMTPGEQALEHLVKLVSKRPALIVLDNEPQAQSAASTIALRLASAGGKAHVQTVPYAKDLAAMDAIPRSAWLHNTMEGL